MYPVVKRRDLATNIVLLEVKAPEVAAKALPGQFIIVRVDEQGERIPLTVMDFNREQGTITIVIQEVGYSSKVINQLQEGDSFLDFVGPLGVATEIENHGRVVCVAGGLGAAPVYPIARALKEAGNEVITIIGARCKDLIILEDELGAVSDKVILATNDGSAGVKGFVTDALAQVLEETDGKVDHIWAIGPMIMMKAVVEYTRDKGLKTIVSMNPIMVDGTGMCGACRISVGGETKFACVDGPEFDGHLVDFDLAMRRLTYFKDEEKRAQARCNCGGGCGCH
ncbi:MAG TPA: sulfide/dihydroorotate dehydrogenase-like FAD/NAD-binding protein [Candidatus Deferrimicrobium sp.]|nr:sulfide/dihydroorotate dehydrogenase-like FAD/NAD-binding protein [Candidatus Deferrimicrobium sp.]